MKPKTFKKVHLSKVGKQFGKLLAITKNSNANEIMAFITFSPLTTDPVRAELYLDFK